MHRRAVLAGGLALIMTGPANAQNARIDVPGGGTIVAPKGYAIDRQFQKSLWRGGVTLFRRMRSVLGGYTECDGIINVCRRNVYKDLDTFCTTMDPAGTTRWEHGNLKPGWTSFDDEKFPVTYGEGPLGRERTQELHLTGSGWLKPRTYQGWRIGFDTPQLWLQAWVMQKDGGVREARKLVGEVVSSFTP
jgi:hypothetical protein